MAPVGSPRVLLVSDHESVSEDQGGAFAGTGQTQPGVWKWNRRGTGMEGTNKDLEAPNSPNWAVRPPLQKAEAFKVLSVGKSIGGEVGVGVEVSPAPRSVPSG